jgi:ATP-binding protein involved in chromosome partitioning
MALWNRSQKSELSSSKQAEKESVASSDGMNIAAPGISHVKNIIAIASGKGGVGKSTVAVNLAYALAVSGARVGLMDADIYGPSQPHLLGALGDQMTVSDDQLVPLDRFGIHFVSLGLLIGNDGPVIWRAPIANKMIRRFIGNVAWGELDYLLIDLPPGTGDVQLTLAQQASLTGAIIVTTPQEVALGVARRGLKMFEQVNVPIIGIIENMSGFVCRHCGKETAIFGEGGGIRMAEEALTVFLGSIPLDREIMVSGEEGVPVLSRYPESSAATAYSDLAGRLRERLAEMGASGNLLEPVDFEMIDSGNLVIRWPDRHESTHTPFHLRFNCPCASCVDENSGRRVLDKSRVPLDIRIRRANRVGRYALSIGFSDGHSTGLYTFKRLRELCECEECARKKHGDRASNSV